MLSGMNLELNSSRRWVKAEYVDASAGFYLPSASCGLKFWGGPSSAVSLHSAAAVQSPESPQTKPVPKLEMVWLHQRSTAQVSFWLH